jgi:hypothetical protein
MILKEGKKTHDTPVKVKDEIQRMTNHVNTSYGTYKPY